MAEASLACWGCKKEPPDGIKFKRCERCAELRLPSTYFCGEACMLANWPRHKKWHKEQKDAAAQWQSSAGWQQATAEQATAEDHARRAQETGDEYDRLSAHAMSLANRGDLQGAVRTFRKIIKMRPERPEAWANLATALFQTRKVEECPWMLLQAMERYEDGTPEWARTTARLFGMLTREDCKEAVKPEWWTDEGLKALSARLVAIAPRDSYACSMRAEVLAARAVGEDPQPWNMGPRTVEELRDAAVWYRRCAGDAMGPDGPKRIRSCADRCDQVANWMAAAADVVASAARKAAEGEAAPARAAAEAEAKEARELAEDKAAAAAEELLAEEAKEKEQAAAKTKAGNAKGKGKKGKGGRR